MQYNRHQLRLQLKIDEFLARAARYGKCCRHRQTNQYFQASNLETEGFDLLCAIRWHQ
jgi:hypothetical protein